MSQQQGSPTAPTPAAGVKRRRRRPKPGEAQATQKKQKLLQQQSPLPQPQVPSAKRGLVEAGALPSAATVSSSTSSTSSHLTSEPFTSLPLSAPTQQALAEGFHVAFMTDVQAACLPRLLPLQPQPPQQQPDLIVQAKTGTGKTLAYLIPIVEAIVAQPAGPAILALVVVPTRELAAQVRACAQRLLTYHHHHCQQCHSDDPHDKPPCDHPHQDHPRVPAVFGGLASAADRLRFQEGVSLLVATPGRLLEHLEYAAGVVARLRCLQFLVLDEMDRLLDEGFWPSIRRIVGFLTRPPDESFSSSSSSDSPCVVAPAVAWRTLLFSATFPPHVKNAAKEITRQQDGLTEMINCIRPEQGPARAHVRQRYAVVPTPAGQILALVTLLRRLALQSSSSNKVLVFFPTARLAQALCELLCAMGIPALELHSRLPQARRLQVCEAFRQYQANQRPSARSSGSGGGQLGLVLCSTDVSARGMDYPDVNCVIQIGLPVSREQYIHRIGRAAHSVAVPTSTTTTTAVGAEGGGPQSWLILCEFERPFGAVAEQLGATEDTALVPTPQARKLLEIGLQRTAVPGGEKLLGKRKWRGSREGEAHGYDHDDDEEGACDDDDDTGGGGGSSLAHKQRRVLQTYVSWLGYYLSHKAHHACHVTELIQLAGDFTCWLFTQAQPPTLTPDLARKLHLPLGAAGTPPPARLIASAVQKHTQKR